MINSPLIFGCEQLGGYNWGNYDIEEVENAIRYAIDNGVYAFDTADCYGNGLSEKRLGIILKSYDREKIEVNTKFGVRIDKDGNRFVDNSSQWIQKSLEESLRRLKTNYIDTFFLHSWDGVTDTNNIFEQLEKFKQLGRIKNYGYSNITGINNENVKTFSLEYSLLFEENQNEIERLTSKNINFYPYGVLAQGMLSGKYKSDHTFCENDRRRNAKYKHFHGEKLVQNLLTLSKLRNISSNVGVNLASFCVYYVKERFQNTYPIVGFKNVNQLKEIIKFREFTFNILELIK